MIKHSLGLLHCLVLVVTTFSCTTLSPQRLQLPAEERLWQKLEDLIAQRLLHIETMAEINQTSEQPILDFARKDERRESLIQRGAGLGLPSQWVNHFFNAQAEAAEITEQAWLNRWKAEEPMIHRTIDAHTLSNALERLDQLDIALLEVLGEARDFLPPESERIQQMTAAMWHRNPDRRFPDQAARVALEGLRFPEAKQPESP